MIGLVIAHWFLEVLEKKMHIMKKKKKHYKKTSTRNSNLAAKRILKGTFFSSC